SKRDWSSDVCSSDLEVFHFDCLWMEEYEWMNFTWNKETFPEPESMLKRLKGKGLKISVWINPYIGQKSSLFDEAMENGYFIKRQIGRASCRERVYRT